MTKTIQLTQGYATIVDDDDYDRLSQHSWYAAVSYDGREMNVRAVRNEYVADRRPRTIPMAREILGIIDEEDIIADHRNGNPLDNRRANLRVTTYTGNAINRRGPNRNSTTGVRGVYKRENGKYRVQITNINFGTFDTVEEAAEAAKKLYTELFNDDE